MAVNLSKGQRVSLDKSVTLARIGLGWDTNKYDGGSDFDLDASVFLLGANGKVLRDEDFVFYNNLNGRNGAVVHTGDNRTGEGDGDDEAIIIDFTKIPPEIEKIAVAVTIFDAQQRNLSGYGLNAAEWLMVLVMAISIIPVDLIRKGIAKAVSNK